jgi:hypothetical protein
MPLSNVVVNEWSTCERGESLHTYLNVSSTSGLTVHMHQADQEDIVVAGLQPEPLSKGHEPAYMVSTSSISMVKIALAKPQVLIPAVDHA